MVSHSKNVEASILYAIHRQYMYVGRYLWNVWSWRRGDWCSPRSPTPQGAMELGSIFGFLMTLSASR